MATSNSSKQNVKNLFQYPELTKQIISDSDKELVQNTINHNYDPFGDAYLGLTRSLSTISKYKLLNVPHDIIKFVISYLYYSETTMDLEIGGTISDPTPSYGTEAFIIISPPISTHLPSNCYILEKIRYRVCDGEWLYNDGEIFIGIQPFNISNITETDVPGNGDILFSKTLKVTKKDNYFTINPMVSLLCGTSYIFWITCIDGVFDGPLVNGMTTSANKRRKQLKLTYSDLMFYLGHSRHFEDRKEYMNCYDIWFTPQI